ncbi:unnamed protein product [Cylindrotheca closterium]|uniref:MORN repeat-containing protein 5 n=1 Tax=Cylindrotheca closterium TaxID=2856 RepID=A0AAD2FFJ9_9STRA|nr:unnamed protein product [Cylindrotheca closterium]
MALHLCRIADSSTTSKPDIFVDSISGDESNERKMYLSYSNQDTRSHNLLESSSSSRRVVERRNSNSTPHLFLPYTGGRKRTNEFEQRCISLMRQELLSDMQAASIAKAMNMASDEAVKGQRAGTKLRHSLHASIFKKVLRRQNDPLVEVDDDDTPDLLTVPDQSSTWEIDFLKDQMKRQQDELDFLRAAMRHLISSMEDVDDLGDEQPIQPMHRSEKESRNPRNVVQPLGIQDRDLLEKLPMIQAPTVQDRDLLEQLPAVNKFPSIIEIPMNFEESDDYSEQMSELQSPSVIVLKNLTQTMKALGKDMPIAQISPAPIPPVSALALQNKFTGLQKGASQKPSYPMHITASIIDVSNDEECKEENMETMQLVVTATSGKQNQRTYTYTDMVKGEVQEGRARGVKYQLHFEKKGVFVEGEYSGTIKSGLPHGSGVLRFANRDLYIGEFSGGRMHGEGSLLSRCNGKLSTFRGIFKNNEFVEPVATAKRVSANELEAEL